MKIKVWQGDEWGPGLDRETAGETWWVLVPPCLLFTREHGLYHRRTFEEAIRVMDFYIGRWRAHQTVIVEPPPVFTSRGDMPGLPPRLRIVEKESADG